MKNSLRAYEKGNLADFLLTTNLIRWRLYVTYIADINSSSTRSNKPPGAKTLFKRTQTLLPLHSGNKGGRKKRGESE